MTILRKGEIAITLPIVFNNCVSPWVDQICLAARTHGATDVFLHEGSIPQVRSGGHVVPLGEEAIPAGEFNLFWAQCGGTEETRDLDTSLVCSDGSRFRVNLCQHLGRRGAVLRPIKTEIPRIDELGLPTEMLQDWAAKGSGLVLVTGPTGSGKSTTLASMLDWINQNKARHIVTVEDPVEYLFTPHSSLFTQREVGTDTPSFAEGLRRSLRQSPDVILVGEIRDRESALTALQAAETGHLVLTTLHTASAPEAVERLVRLFPAEEREGILDLIAVLLIGVLTQHLLPGMQGGMVVVAEHFENQGASRKWIREGKMKDLADLVARGDHPRNISFMNALVTACREGKVAEATALETAPNPQEFQRLLKGIVTGGAVRPR